MTTSSEPTAEITRRATISFPGGTRAVVDELTARREISVKELVRRALATYKHIDDAETRGAKVLIQEVNGSLRELVFIL